MRAEKIVAEDATEAVSLRLRRLTSTTLVKRLLADKGFPLEDALLQTKAEGVAWAVNSALGYWEPNLRALNARLLNRYYALMQISIAEQVAITSNNDTLRDVQKATEEGHGLFIVHSPEGEFPNNLLVGCQKRGHFYHYCMSRGIAIDAVAFDSRLRDWKQKYESKVGTSLISLGDLLSRVPECAGVVAECFGRAPLSFQVIGAGPPDDDLRIESWTPGLLGATHTQRHLPSRVQIVPYEGQTLEWLIALNDDTFKGAEIHIDSWSEAEHFIAALNTDAKLDDWFARNTYKSGYCPTSYIVPFWGSISDSFILHYVILYAMSIVVRYEPLLWHDIDVGSLDHIRALLEHYAFMVDRVLPPIMSERITGRRLLVTQPGSWSAPL